MHYHDVMSDDRERLERSISTGLSDFLPAGDLQHTLDLWRASAWSLEEVWDELEYYAPTREAKDKVRQLERELDL